MRLGIAILAAGKGTRLRSKRAKVLHEVGGLPLLRQVIAAAAQVVEPSDIVAVVGHQAETVEAAVRDTGIRFARQTEQRGTGHALQCAANETRAYDHLIVLSGDVPLLRAETIGALRDFHLREQAAMTILTAIAVDPFGYGRVIRRNARRPEVAAIVEQKALTAEQEQVREINTGIYAFRRAALYANLGKLRADNAHRELYLTDMARILTEAGERVMAVKAADPDEVLGANTIAEMMELDRQMRAATVRRLMDAGVTIFRPETVTIDAGVEVGPDTTIEPFAQLLGKTRVGSDCRIRSYTVIENSVLGDGVVVRQSCVVTESNVAKGATIGPFAHLRPGSQIGEGAHVGNFVETKKTKMGAGSKANHLAYLGDAQIGSGVNIGAGAITCNYDGAAKHETRIEDGVFIGSDSTLVAPVTIGKGAYVAAGSSITEDVPADALALGRAQQVVKPGWARARRQQRQEGRNGKGETRDER